MQCTSHIIPYLHFSTAETCEELFTRRAPHIDLALSGVEVISNGSGSHHQVWTESNLHVDVVFTCRVTVYCGCFWYSDIFSHFFTQLRKLDQRLDLIRGATAKVWMGSYQAPAQLSNIHTYTLPHSGRWRVPLC